MRYRVNSDTKVIHDTHSKCDDVKNPDLKAIGYREFKMLIQEGFDPCDTCFRSDPAEEEKDAGESA